MKLWNYIKMAMLQNPKQLVCENEARMSYEELVIFAEIFAEKIAEEKCCGILCSSEMAAAMALLACFAADVTAVPISAKYGERHCRKIQDMIGPTAVITDMDGSLQVLHPADTKYVEQGVTPALIMCTSGTTGMPKGAMLSGENIITNVKDIASYLNITKADSILISRPIYHCAVLTGEFLVSLLKGVRIHFYSGQFHPKVIFKLIAEKEITVFGGTPTLLDIMARFKRAGGKCTLKTICISGECMSRVTGQRIAAAFDNTEIYHVYGLTEASPRISYLPPRLFRSFPDSVGFLLNSVSLKIVKTDGKPAGMGEEGILWVKGKNIMLGYYNAPEQTKKVLKDGWLCTGDIAIIGVNGLLKIKGRNDNMIIRAGMNIYPQEIEAELKKDIRTKEVYVYKVEDFRGNIQIGMDISGEFGSTDEVHALCKMMLPPYQIPTVIRLVDEIPKNGSGKIIREKTNIKKKEGMKNGM